MIIIVIKNTEQSRNIIITDEPTLVVLNWKCSVHAYTASKQWHRACPLKRCFVSHFGAGYVQHIIQQYESTTVWKETLQSK